jgi:hypothetical protein
MALKFGTSQLPFDDFVEEIRTLGRFIKIHSVHGHGETLDLRLVLSTFAGRCFARSASGLHPDARQDFFDPSHQLPDKPRAESSTSEINNISKILGTSNGASLELALTSFANVFLKGERKSVRELEAKQGIQYLLLNADNWFERICKSDLTQLWLERAAMRGRKTYLITGLQTLRDVDIKLNTSWKVGAGAGVEASLLLATAGIPMPTPLDPGARADCSIEGEVKNEGSVADEKIYAIQYREVKLRKLIPSRASAPVLTGKIWWEQICSDRGAEDDEMDQDDDEIIEAQLLDGVEDTADVLVASSEEAEEEAYLYA